jgi:hypothetical protein
MTMNNVTSHELSQIVGGGWAERLGNWIGEKLHNLLCPHADTSALDSDPTLARAMSGGGDEY